MSELMKKNPRKPGEVLFACIFSYSLYGGKLYNAAPIAYIFAKDEASAKAGVKRANLPRIIRIEFCAPAIGFVALDENATVVEA